MWCNDALYCGYERLYLTNSAGGIAAVSKGRFSAIISIREASWIHMCLGAAVDTCHILNSDRCAATHTTGQHPLVFWSEIVPTRRRHMEGVKMDNLTNISMGSI